MQRQDWLLWMRQKQSATRELRHSPFVRSCRHQGPSKDALSIEGTFCLSPPEILISLLFGFGCTHTDASSPVPGALPIERISSHRCCQSYGARPLLFLQDLNVARGLRASHSPNRDKQWSSKHDPFASRIEATTPRTIHGRHATSEQHE